MESQEGVTGTIKSENIKEATKMTAGIFGFAKFLCQNKLDENIAQLEEVGAQIIVLISGIGFSSSSTQGVVYNLFGVFVLLLIVMVFFHFARIMWKEIRHNSVPLTELAL